MAIRRCRLRPGGSSCRTRELMSSSRTPHSARFAARLRLGGYRDSRHCPERVAVRAAHRSLITSAGRPPGLRHSPTCTTAPEFATMLMHPVAALSVAQSLATTGCVFALARGLLFSAMCGRCPCFGRGHQSTPCLWRMARLASFLNFSPRRIGSRTTLSAFMRRMPSFSRNSRPRSPWDETNSS